MTPIPAAAIAAPATPVWQNPYVEVIRYGLAHRSVGWLGQGDVEQETDKQIHKNVFKIRGAIASANFVRFPREMAKGNQGLGLTGRFVYVQLRRARNQHVTLHLDVLTAKKTALRFSLSSMYSTLRSTGSVLRVPLELSETWTTMAIDVAEMLQLHTFNGYNRETYRYLKAVTCCSSMNLRNIVTSSTYYTMATIPNALVLPASRENQCGPYVWLSLPAEGHLKSVRSPSKTAKNSASNQQPTTSIISESDSDGQDWEDDGIAITPLPSQSTPPTMAAPDDPTPQPVLSPTVVTGGLPLSPTSRETGLLRDRQDVLARADQIMRDAGFSVPSPRRARAVASEGPTTTRISPRRFLASEHSDWPDPILSLHRIIGFSHSFPSALRWIPDAAACVYACHSTLVLRWFPTDLSMTNTSTNQHIVRPMPLDSDSVDHDYEEFLTGHTGAVGAMEISRDGVFLATAQSQPDAVLRVWDLRQRSSVVVLKLAMKSVHALAFSPDASSLCAVGEDAHARTQIVVWDASAITSSSTTSPKKLVLQARQTSDFPVHAVAFSPYEPNQLVSCGKENVRFWRIHSTRHHLPGAPVILREYSRGTLFTAVAFDRVYPQFPSNLPRLRPVYVASSAGAVLVVDYDSRQVVAMHQLHDAPIRSLCVNEGFCVSGADDKFLRVWPLDFGDFFLEAEHDAAVTTADISSDGLQVVVGTVGGAVGVLRLADQKYKTVLRSHTQTVRTLATLPDGSLVTSGDDGTLRVWDPVAGSQTMEFDISSDRVTCLAALPQVGTNETTIAVGFHSGCTRIFTLATDRDTTDQHPQEQQQPRVVHEFQQHQSPLIDVQYQIDGSVFFTAGSGQQLCMYDAANGYTPLKMLIADIASDASGICLSQDKRFLAAIQQGGRGILLLDATSLCVLRVLTPPSQQPMTSVHSKRSSDDVELTQVAISWNSQELMAVSKGDRLYVFSLCERGESFGAMLHSMPLLGQQGISSFALCPNLKYMATGGGDGSVRVWQCDHGRHKPQRMHQTFLLHAGTGAVRQLTFSRDGKHVVAASDSASAVFVWRFRGNTSQLPTLELTSPTLGARQDLMMEPARVPAAKPAFHLPLETIKAKTPERMPMAGTSPGDSMPSVKSKDLRPVDEVTLAESTTKQARVDWRQLGSQSAVSSDQVVWCCALGLLIVASPSSQRIQVEALDSGAQYSLELDSIIDRMVLSPTEKTLAVLPVTSMNSVNLVDISSLRDDNQAEFMDGGDIHSSRTRQVAIPQRLRRVEAVAFTVDDHRLCILGELCSSGRRVLIVIDTTEESMARVYALDGLSDAPVSVLVAQTPDELLCVQMGQAQPLQRIHFVGNAHATVEPCMNVALPGGPQILHVCHRDDGVPVDGSGLLHTRYRYWLALDRNALGLFVDLERQAVMLAAQLVLPVGISMARVTAIHWVGSQDWQGIILVVDDRTILVLPLPIKKPSGAVDWQHLKRVGRVSSSHSVSLPQAISHVVVDPMSDVGMVFCDDGSIFCINFRSAQRRLLRSPVISASESAVSPQLAVDGTLLLMLSRDHHSLHCWEPTIGKELARMHFTKAKCSVFVVSPFEPHLVVAGLDDGSMRLLDVAEQRVVAQWSMPPRPRQPTAKRTSATPVESLSILKRQQASKRFDPHSPHARQHDTERTFHHVRFIGPRCVMVVTNPTVRTLETTPRVILFDLVDVSITVTEVSSSTQEPTPRSTRKDNQAKKEQSIQYREIVLPTGNAKRRGIHASPQQDLSSWLTTVVSVDVQQLSIENSSITAKLFPDAIKSTHPFLLVVHTVQPLSNGSVTVVHSYGGTDAVSGHPVYADDDVTPVDSWLINTAAVSFAVFHAMKPSHVLAVTKHATDTASNAVVNQPHETVAQWCIEERDLRGQCVVTRFKLPTKWCALASSLSLHWCRMDGRQYMVVSGAQGTAQSMVDLPRLALFHVENGGTCIHSIPSVNSTRSRLLVGQEQEHNGLTRVCVGEIRLTTGYMA